MPPISLLEPTVLLGVVEKLTAPESLTLLRSMPREPHPFPSAQWDVVQGSRTVARPNIPNSEAHIVPKLGVAQQSASFIYLREKKVFEPTTLHWIREPGQLARTNAERSVLREVTDLNQRFDNFAEWVCWQALKGTLTLTYDDVKQTVDYGIPASHKPTVSTSWATATAAQVREDIVAWKRLITRDSRVAPRTAYATEFTINRIMRAFGDDPVLLSDRMKDRFFSTGMLPGFLGLDWQTAEQVYDTDAGVRTLFLADDELIIANLTENRAMRILEGPTADDDAPKGHTGKFSKTWKEKDPSARQFLLEWNFIPVITHPEQIVYVADVAPGA